MWIYVDKKNITRNISKLIYNMTKKTYNKDIDNVKKKRKFYSYDDMMNMYDLYYYYYSKKKIKSIMILKKFPLAYKIVMISSDNTQYGKQILFNKLSNLISTPGYMIEMSGKPFWIKFFYIL